MNEQPSTIDVIVVDDDNLVRHALVDYLKIDAAIRVLASFPRGDLAVEFANRHHVDVALVDIHMPGKNGVQVTRDLRSAHSKIKVLILTSFDEEVAMHGALDAGASGFLLKSTSPEALVDAIRAVHRGISVVSPGPMSRMRVMRPKPESGPVTQLSEREHEVLVLLCKGQSNLEIATNLFISESSVKTHVTNVMQKFGVSSRLRAVVRAHELGFDRR